MNIFTREFDLAFYTQWSRGIEPLLGMPQWEARERIFSKVREALNASALAYMTGLDNVIVPVPELRHLYQNQLANIRVATVELAYPGFLTLLTAAAEAVSYETDRIFLGCYAWNRLLEMSDDLRKSLKELNTNTQSDFALQIQKYLMEMLGVV